MRCALRLLSVRIAYAISNAVAAARRTPAVLEPPATDASMRHSEASCLSTYGSYNWWLLTVALGARGLLKSLRYRILRKLPVRVATAQQQRTNAANNLSNEHETGRPRLNLRRSSAIIGALL